MHSFAIHTPTPCPYICAKLERVVLSSHSPSPFARLSLRVPRLLQLAKRPLPPRTRAGHHLSIICACGTLETMSDHNLASALARSLDDRSSGGRTSMRGAARRLVGAAWPWRPYLSCSRSTLIRLRRSPYLCSGTARESEMSNGMSNPNFAAAAWHSAAVHRDRPAVSCPRRTAAGPVRPRFGRPFACQPEPRGTRRECRQAFSTSTCSRLELTIDHAPLVAMASLFVQTAVSPSP